MSASHNRRASCGEANVDDEESEAELGGQVRDSGSFIVFVVMGIRFRLGKS